MGAGFRRAMAWFAEIRRWTPDNTIESLREAIVDVQEDRSNDAGLRSYLEHTPAKKRPGLLTKNRLKNERPIHDVVLNDLRADYPNASDDDLEAASQIAAEPLHKVISTGKP